MNYLEGVVWITRRVEKPWDSNHVIRRTIRLDDSEELANQKIGGTKLEPVRTIKTSSLMESKESAMKNILKFTFFLIKNFLLPFWLSAWRMLRNAIDLSDFKPPNPRID